MEGILDSLTDDVRWQIIGGADLRGKKSVPSELEAMKDVVTSEHEDPGR